MQLTCPHCQFSKKVLDAKLPAKPTRVTCPQCKKSFALPQSSAEPADSPQTSCPACGTEQPETATCSSCGLIIAKYRPPQQQAALPVAPNNSENLADRPKAGFWLRLVAFMLDGFLVSLMQVLFGILLMVTGINGFDLQDSMSILVQIFAIVLFLFYWVFFTGYCGQTPGKMLLRIQVVGSDGETIGYRKAFYREVIGKTIISNITFGVGYLMVAFDDQKQALHDRMAKTYVVKL